MSITLNKLISGRSIRSGRHILRFLISVGATFCILSAFTLAQAQQAQLAIPDSFFISRSDSGLAIPISLDNSLVGAVRGVQIFIAFPGDHLEIQGLERTVRTLLIETFEINVPDPGDLRVVILSFEGSNPIEPGIGPIANLRVNVRDGTARGTLVPLDMVQDGTSATAVFDSVGTPISLIVSGGVGTVTIPVQGLTITPDSPVLPEGNSLIFEATAAFIDGTMDIVTTEATWVSEDSTVATIDAAGVATGRSIGTTTIFASLQGVQSEIETLTVVADTFPPVLLTGPNVAVDGARNVTVSWDTNESSTSLIHYGPSRAYGAEVADTLLVKQHSLTIPAPLSDSLYYRLQSVDGKGNVFESLGFVFAFPSTGIDGTIDAAPEETGATVANVFPNPFNGGTSIALTVMGELGLSQNPVRLVIYNLLGQEIRTLVDELRSSGTYTIGWDGRNAQGGEVASGVYILRLETAQSTEARRIILLR